MPKTTLDISVVTNENIKYQLTFTLSSLYTYMNQRAIKNQLDMAERQFTPQGLDKQTQ